VSNLNAELIIWVDPYVLDRPWNNDNEIEQELGDVKCHTVGYVAKETDEFVVLAQGYSLKDSADEVAEWGHCWVLPKICIIARHEMSTRPPVGSPKRWDRRTLTFNTVVDKDLGGRDYASVDEVFENPSATHTVDDLD
jgi:hypothetical protein